MTDPDSPRDERAPDEIDLPDEALLAMWEEAKLADLVDQIGCSSCDADGLCPACTALASLFASEIRLRQQRD